MQALPSGLTHGGGSAKNSCERIWFCREQLGSCQN